MVGGGVRDLLAGMEPKDFDIATSAHPEEVRKLFRGCRLIGRRFIICHVRMGAEVAEVTTFRGPITDGHERDETGRILSDNVYGTLEQDAFRRDFTVNALYYDVRDFSIADFAGGVEDMKAEVVRMIGDPELRYREDPVRMLRVVRIANKLKFAIHPATAEPIHRLAHLLAEIPPARLFDEVIKVLQSRDALANYEALAEHGLFAQLFPDTDKLAETDDHADDFISLALHGTADRVEQDLPVSPAFLYAALLWPPVLARMKKLVASQGQHVNTAIAQAGEEILARAQARITIPKRYSIPMREIWQMQPRFELKNASKAKRLLAHPRFRAAYDFLLIRAETGEVPQELADWWTQAQEGFDFEAARRNRPGGEPSEDIDAGLDGEEAAPSGVPGDRQKKRRRRRGGRNRNRGGGEGGGGGAPSE